MIVKLFLFRTCLFVHSHNSKTTLTNFTKFFVHVVCGNNSVLLLTTSRYVMYFPFCILHFHIMGSTVRIKHDVMFRRSSSSGSTSWTSVNYSIWSSSSECGTGGEVCYLWLTCFLTVVQSIPVYLTACWLVSMTGSVEQDIKHCSYAQLMWKRLLRLNWKCISQISVICNQIFCMHTHADENLKIKQDWKMPRILLLCKIKTLLHVKSKVTSKMWNLKKKSHNSRPLMRLKGTNT